MRIVFVGASNLSIMTARLMLRRGHEVVIVEWNKEKIAALSGELDCGFVHGDGSTPAVLRETNPNESDFLLCLTGNDQTNIIASLVGRSLQFKQVVTRIDDPEFEHICIELGLEHTIIPSRTIGRHLFEMVEGRDPLELSALIKNDATVFSFVAKAEDAVTVNELDLPKDCRVMCVYRDERLHIPDGDFKLQIDDEVVLFLNVKHVGTVKRRWAETSGAADD